MRISSAIALVSMAATAMFTGLSADAAEPVVKVLTSENFKDVINQKFVLVDFYAPWCGHCQNLEPEYDAAAKMLREDEDIQLAKVDCVAEKEICKTYEVGSYPTLKIFREGIPREYKGNRKSDGIISYLRKHAAPPVTVLTAETLPAFAESENVVVVAVLPANDPQREEVDKIARYYRDDFIFGVVEEHPDVKAPAVVLYKKFDEGKNILEGEITDAKLVNFVRANCLPMVDEIGATNYAHYMDASVPLAYLFYANTQQRDGLKQGFEAVAKEWKGKLNFVYLDATKYGAHAANVGLKEDWPAFAVQDVNTAEKFPLEQNSEPITEERMRQHITDVLAGINKAKVKSEAIPESNDGPVTIVVGHNYDEVVHNKDKDVLIEYYAPWCGFCKRLEPIYDELGELYKGSNVVIAKLDATANDLPASVPFAVSGYPTIKFKKAGQDNYIDYSGERTTAAFVNFLRKNAVNKVEIVDPEGLYEPKLKSEAVPETQDGPVTVVVANNYEQVVHDNDKDVLIEYYAPWCGFCKRLVPIYDELGALYKGSNIVIAKFDATANDLPSSVPFAVSGYPTIKFKKAGSKDYIDYKGERTTEGFVTFLRKNAANKFEIADPEGLYQPKLKSEAIPATRQGCLDRRLAPIYDELGALYKGSNIVIAKLDATANDLPSSVPFAVDGYPTIKFKKAGSKDYIDYSGERTTEAFIAFLEKNAVNKVEVKNDTKKEQRDEL
ncbi:protein disulfide-isomerase precursor [Linnemannia exigua]|uniref:Protein disulfide-isomerase n=1 Tax=Linnemannia exigua TaxID=604196 RepID=A0AAD4DAS2_9FUNG|nr:protein disulfide-isomerase precursor [Linnemannia exigua]